MTDLRQYGLSPADYAMTVGMVMGEAMHEGLVGMGIVAATGLNRAQNPSAYLSRSASLGDIFAAPYSAGTMINATREGRSLPGTGRQFSPTFNSNIPGASTQGHQNFKAGLDAALVAAINPSLSPQLGIRQESFDRAQKAVEVAVKARDMGIDLGYGVEHFSAPGFEREAGVGRNHSRFGGHSLSPTGGYDRGVTPPNRSEFASRFAAAAALTGIDIPDDMVADITAHTNRGQIMAAGSIAQRQAQDFMSAQLGQDVFPGVNYNDLVQPTGLGAVDVADMTGQLGIDPVGEQNFANTFGITPDNYETLGLPDPIGRVDYQGQLAPLNPAELNPVSYNEALGPPIGGLGWQGDQFNNLSTDPLQAGFSLPDQGMPDVMSQFDGPTYPGITHGTAFDPLSGFSPVDAAPVNFSDVPYSSEQAALDRAGLGSQRLSDNVEIRTGRPEDYPNDLDFQVDSWNAARETWGTPEVNPLEGSLGTVVDHVMTGKSYSDIDPEDGWGPSSPLADAASITDGIFGPAVGPSSWSADFNPAPVSGLDTFGPLASEAAPQTSGFHSGFDGWSAPETFGPDMHDAWSARNAQDKVDTFADHQLPGISYGNNDQIAASVMAELAPKSAPSGLSGMSTSDLENASLQNERDFGTLNQTALTGWGATPSGLLDQDAPLSITGSIPGQVGFGSFGGFSVPSTQAISTASLPSRGPAVSQGDIEQRAPSREKPETGSFVGWNDKSGLTLGGMRSPAEALGLTGATNDFMDAMANPDIAANYGKPSSGLGGFGWGDKGVTIGGYQSPSDMFSGITGLGKSVPDRGFMDAMANPQIAENYSPGILDGWFGGALKGAGFGALTGGLPGAIAGGLFGGLNIGGRMASAFGNQFGGFPGPSWDGYDPSTMGYGFGFNDRGERSHTGADNSGNATVGDGSYGETSGRNDNNPAGIL
jgi:hypothetical protein